MNIPQIFDRKIIRQKKNIASQHFTDFLKIEAVNIVAEKISELNLNKNQILDIGCHNGLLAQKLEQDIFCADLSYKMLQCTNNISNKINCDEELIPFKKKSFDVVTNVISLHLVNDIIGSLCQINQIIKDNGVFIMAIFGRETLKELRHAFSKAEDKLYGGISPRIAPFIDSKQVSELLQRANFKDIVVDNHIIKVKYGDFYKLLKDIRNMGESGILQHRLRKFSSKKLFVHTEEIFMQSINSEVSFEFIFATAWK